MSFICEVLRKWWCCVFRNLVVCILAFYLIAKEIKIKNVKKCTSFMCQYLLTYGSQNALSFAADFLVRIKSFYLILSSQYRMKFYVIRTLLILIIITPTNRSEQLLYMERLTLNTFDTFNNTTL